ncbi:quinolinate synthase NadA [bacterium]|nr:quinolinate synthase NadA [bacterium]MBU1065850.1 quinolinate synthase NadA [bacterium]MBU1634173.1 quinolinate synthase NadA [bacterium]MBU1872792.1 quinolinate synthase NadA [bacterium]
MTLNPTTIPKDFLGLSADELNKRIIEVKAKLGKRLLILGHHYMSDDVIAHANERGDSFALAKIAAQTDAEFIVFCGVHFMAETADIVTTTAQKVFIPDPGAGCFLADCARIRDVEDAWQEIKSMTSEIIVPITYVNSGADMKAFCGDNGGLVCTSSNAARALKWAFERGEKVFFFPDQHLGRNTAFAMGIPLNEIILWDPDEPLGGNSLETIKQARVILWDGFCIVHQEFNVDYIEKLRQDDPQINIIVHPECDFDVAQVADYMGSTAYIIRMIAEAPSGSHWAVATERNLVNRLKKAYPDKRIEILQFFEPYCKSMAQINLTNLAYQLDQIDHGNLINQVIVEEQYAVSARIALNRMLELTQ